MTLLNRANNLMLGTQAVSAVYVGTTQIWRPPALYVSSPHDGWLYKLSGGTTTHFYGTGSTTSPAGIAIHNGTIYLYDEGLEEFFVIPLGGSPSTIPITGVGSPNGLATDKAGNLYFSDGAQVYKWDGSTKTSVGFTGLASPYQVAVDSSGAIYVSDYGRSAVFKMSGIVQTTLGFTLSGPVGCAVDSAGNVYTSDYADQSVWKLTPGGVQSNLAASEGAFYGCTIDAYANLYVADYSNNQIYQISGTTQTTIPFTGTAPQYLAFG